MDHQIKRFLLNESQTLESKTYVNCISAWRELFNLEVSELSFDFI